MSNVFVDLVAREPCSLVTTLEQIAKLPQRQQYMVMALFVLSEKANQRRGLSKQFFLHPDEFKAISQPQQTHEIAALIEQIEEVTLSYPSQGRFEAWSSSLVDCLPLYHGSKGQNAAEGWFIRFGQWIHYQLMPSGRHALPAIAQAYLNARVKNKQERWLILIIGGLCADALDGGESSSLSLPIHILYENFLDAQYFDKQSEIDLQNVDPNYFRRILNYLEKCNVVQIVSWEKRVLGESFSPTTTKSVPHPDDFVMLS